MPFKGIFEFLTPFGTPISAIALILAIVFFLLQRKKRSLVYIISPTPLITNKMTDIPGLEVFFEGQPIKNITSTTVKFFNTGNQLLEPKHIAALQPLRLCVSGQFLLGQTGVQTTADNPSSTPSLELNDDHTGNLAFDFLEPKKCFAITLLHTGELTVAGELKGGSVTAYSPGPSWIDLITIIYASICVLLFFVFIVLWLFVNQELFSLIIFCAFLFFMLLDADLLIDYFRRKRLARSGK